MDWNGVIVGWFLRFDNLEREGCVEWMELSELVEFSD